MTDAKNLADLEALQRIVNGCLRPHAPTIAVIGFTGEVAVVLHEPGEKAKARARALGWDGKSEVFRLTAEGKTALAGSAEPSDAGIAAWLGRKFEPAAPVARIYVLSGDDALLMNFSPFGGWAQEPAAAAGPLPGQRN
jgi:hypothetical protein